MSQIELDKVKAKIRALASKTISNGCTESEAMSAMEMVGRLLETYSLSIDEVAVGLEEYKEIRIGTGMLRKSPLDFLIVELARFCDCIVYFTKPTRTNREIQYVFFGQESDILMVEYLFHHLKKALETETLRFTDGEYYKKNPKHMPRRTLSDSFRKAWCSTVSNRLEKMRGERQDVVLESNGKSLILTKDAVTKEEFRRRHGRLPGTSQYGSYRYDSHSYFSGKDAANNINLSRPINSGNGPLMIGYSK